MVSKARFAVIAAFCCLSTVTHAQQLPTTDPSRLDERLRDRPPAPSVKTDIVPDLPQQSAAPEGNLSVSLTAVRFEGATAVPVDVLNAIAAPYLNRNMPIAEIFRLAEAVTAEYRRRGFVLSRAVVGPQRIEGGVLTVQVLEGYVGSTRIEGDAGGYRRFIKGYIEPVKQARPASGDALSRALLLMRDLEGVDVRAIITPSTTEIGAADLTLSVTRDPIDGFFAVDNRGSRFLGPIQLYGGVVLHDLLGLGERLGVTGVWAPENTELGFVSGTYSQPVGNSGLRLDAFGSYARTSPGATLRPLGIEGESATWGVGATYPFIRSRRTNLQGRLVLTGRDSNSISTLVNPIFSDKIRTIAFEGFVNHADARGGLASARVSVTQGVGVLGATTFTDIDKSRATGSGIATRVNLEASYRVPIAGGFSILLGGAGQITGDSLLAAEEFGLGGLQYGRAYDPSEITGDTGFAGKVEAYWTLPKQNIGVFEPFVYYEGGQVGQNRPLPGEERRTSITSVGGGLRGTFASRFNASVEYTKPLTRDVAAKGNRDGRFFFSVSANF